VAAIGDAAPGGGQFAGPGFTGWPAAAGNGWVAFRGQVTGGDTREALVAARMTSPRARLEIAHLRQVSPGTGELAACAGTFKEFLARPAVNAAGDVAFLALIEPDQAQADAKVQPAGIFLFRGNALSAVACSGQRTAAGTLDLLSTGDTGDVVERTPALNDTGDVAFLAGLAEGGAAIFNASPGEPPDRVVGIDDRYDGSVFQHLGPPALNNSRRIAFHGRVAPGTDGGDAIDGIFVADTGVVSLVVRDGIPILDTTIKTFEDPVSLNDAGDVAFLAGPLPDEEGGPGVLVCNAGVVSLLAYPGQPLEPEDPGSERVSGVTLSSAAGSELAPPVIAPDGSVVFFLVLTDGEMIARWDEETGVEFLVRTAGTASAETPVEGFYAGAASAPVTDAVGGIAFRARIAGAATSEAIVYRARDGSASAVVLGEAVPGTGQAGFFGGRPFSAPVINDRGDVVFRSFVTRGPSSVGIFRARDGRLEAVVRAGDRSPTQGGAPFLDIVGEPSLNNEGSIAFAAQVRALGRGIYVAEAAGLRAIALRGDPVAGESHTTLTSFATRPVINDAGVVAFRGFSAHRDPISQRSTRREGLFVADDLGVRTLVYADTPSPSGPPFASLHDPRLTNLPSLVFRAPLRLDDTTQTALFITDANGTIEIARRRQDLGAGIVLGDFGSDPAVAPTGQIAFLATRLRAGESLGPAIVTRTDAGLMLVTARNMPGPGGGVVRTLSAPSINAAGHVAFRAAFLPDTGGTTGLFLGRGNRLSPIVLRDEATPIGGRFTSFDTRTALNAHDEVAFSATVSGGEAREGIFLASPTTLTIARLALRLTGTRGRDRIRVRAALALGRLGDGVDPRAETVTIALSDTTGPLWSVTVPGTQLSSRGNALRVKPRRQTSLGRRLRALKLVIGRDGRTVRAGAQSGKLNLSESGERPLTPPFTVTVQIGNDSGFETIDCLLGRRGGRCL
jgi:hypothetical protein